MDHDSEGTITQKGYTNFDFFQTTTKTQTLVVGEAINLVVGVAINHKYLLKKPPLNSNDNSFMYNMLHL